MLEKKNTALNVIGFFFRILLNILLIMAVIYTVSAAYRFSYKLFVDYPYKSTSKEYANITVTEGESVRDLAKVLDSYGIVDGELLFIVRAYIGGYHDDIKPGTYKLGPGMSPDTICRVVCNIEVDDKK